MYLLYSWNNGRRSGGPKNSRQLSLPRASHPLFLKETRETNAASSDSTNNPSEIWQSDTTGLNVPLVLFVLLLFILARVTGYLPKQPLKADGTFHRPWVGDSQMGSGRGRWCSATDLLDRCWRAAWLALIDCQTSMTHQKLLFFCRFPHRCRTSAGKIIHVQANQRPCAKVGLRFPVSTSRDLTNGRNYSLASSRVWAPKTLAGNERIAFPRILFLQDTLNLHERKTMARSFGPVRPR